jgi:hypothetical protein
LTCSLQFCLCLPVYSSTDSVLSSSTISSFCLWSLFYNPLYAFINLIYAAVILDSSFFLMVQASHPQANRGWARVSLIFILVCFCTNDGFTTEFTVPSFYKSSNFVWDVCVMCKR